MLLNKKWKDYGKNQAFVQEASSSIFDIIKNLKAKAFILNIIIKNNKIRTVSPGRLFLNKPRSIYSQFCCFPEHLPNCSASDFNHSVPPCFSTVIHNHFCMWVVFFFPCSVLSFPSKGLIQLMFCTANFSQSPFPLHSPSPMSFKFLLAEKRVSPSPSWYFYSMTHLNTSRLHKATSTTRSIL